MKDSRFLGEKTAWSNRLTRVCAMGVPFWFDPFRVGDEFCAVPVALPPAIKFVRCADATIERQTTTISDWVLTIEPLINYPPTRLAKYPGR